MHGGLMQLVANNVQDETLTGHPDITFFQDKYKRYTKFASETQILNFDTKPYFGNTVVCKIPRHADLFINANNLSKFFSFIDTFNNFVN